VPPELLAGHLRRLEASIAAGGDEIRIGTPDEGFRLDLIVLGDEAVDRFRKNRAALPKLSTRFGGPAAAKFSASASGGFVRNSDLRQFFTKVRC